MEGISVGRGCSPWEELCRHLDFNKLGSKQTGWEEGGEVRGVLETQETQETGMDASPKAAKQKHQ